MLYGFDHGHKANLLRPPDARLVAVQIKIMLKVQTAPVLQISSVVGGDPPVMSAQHQNHPGVGLERGELIDTLLQPVSRLARYQITGVLCPFNKPLVAAVAIAGYVADVLQYWEDPMLQISRSRFAQPNVKIDLVFAVVAGHGRRAGRMWP